LDATHIILNDEIRSYVKRKVYASLDEHIQNAIQVAINNKIDNMPPKDFNSLVSKNLSNVLFKEAKD